MGKLRNVILGSCLFLLAFGVYLYAQKPGSEQLISQNPEYNSLAARLDALSDKVEKINSELSGKLDRVLSNQEEILKELGVIRVRVSRSAR